MTERSPGISEGRSGHGGSSQDCGTRHQDSSDLYQAYSGGRLSSNFGRRKSPTKGASSYHKGVDWSVPTGTAVFASCGGTVARAGWGSGYGYCVYINHEDGRQTRYGHLSKVLVKVGQTVKQGERIALSGNTGVSTGPHLPLRSSLMAAR